MTETKHPRILIVEDEPDWHRTYEMIQREYGIRFRMAINHSDCLMKLTEAHYDLVILDPQSIHPQDTPMNRMFRTVDDVAEKIRDLQPGIEIALTSGFIEGYRESGSFTDELYDYVIYKGEIGEFLKKKCMIC